MKLIKVTDLVEGDYVFVYDNGRCDYTYLGFCKIYKTPSYIGTCRLDYEEIVSYSVGLLESGFQERRSNKTYMVDNSEFYYKLSDDEILRYIVVEVV